MDNLFILIQWSIFVNSLLILHINLSMRESDIIITVSSAKSFVAGYEANGKSLTYIRNKRRPRIDPCGTPQVKG